VTTMRAAVVRSFDEVGVETVPRPTAPPGGLLVRTHACGICSGDVMPWYIERKAPLVLGHEMAGTVVAVAEGAPFAVGDRVFAHHHAPCGDCEFCRRGQFVQCPTWKQPAVTPGGCAEFFAVAAHGAAQDTLKLPDGLSLDAACLIEPVACAVKAIRRVPAPLRGGVAVVLGLGPMGLLLARLAAHAGASRVIGVDRVPFRLELARGFGATDLVDFSKEDTVAAVRRLTDGRGADLVWVGPPHAAAMETGLACAGPGAFVVWFSPANPGERFAYDPNAVYFNEIQLLPSYSCGPDDTRAALQLLIDGVVDAEALITHRFGLADVAAAYRLTAAGGASAKVLVRVDEGSAV